MENVLVACVGSGLQWNQSVTGTLCWHSASGPLAVGSATSASSWSTIWRSIWRPTREPCMPVPTAVVGSESMPVSFVTGTCARARAGPLLTGLTSDWGHILTSRTREPLLLMDTYPSLPWHLNHGSYNHARRIYHGPLVLGYGFQPGRFGNSEFSSYCRFFLITLQNSGLQAICKLVTCS